MKIKKACVWIWVVLRIGKIMQVERVPQSKKLLKLQVDLGTEQRTIVSGIGEKMDDLTLLIGKHIVVVANLKPVKLMGIESQGMLLAAEASMGAELLLVHHRIRLMVLRCRRPSVPIRYRQRTHRHG